MIKHFDHISLGGGLASLVTVYELLKKGIDVALYADERSIGGHFRPYECLGTDFDLGMLLLEFDSYQAQELDTEKYDPSIVSSVGAFSELAKTYLERFFEFTEVERIFVAQDGQLLEDFYISNDLIGLKRYFEKLEPSILSELSSRTQNSILHPKNKYQTDQYEQLSYLECSLYNHGSAIHDQIIEPLVAKSCGESSSNLSAAHHRLFWAPLFYPETLVTVFRDQSPPIVKTKFHVPMQGPVGRISDILMEEINQYPNLHRGGSPNNMSKKTGGWIINGESQSTSVSTTLPQDTLGRLTGKQMTSSNKSSYLIAFIELDVAVNFDVLFCADTSFNLFRLSSCRARGLERSIVAEYNLDYAGLETLTSAEVSREISTLLKQYFGMNHVGINDIHLVPLLNKLTFPTFNNLTAAAKNNHQLNELRELTRMGPSLGIHSSSLNAQIVQGLQCAARL